MAIAIMNGLFVQIVMASRVLYGLARESMLPAVLGKLDAKRATYTYHWAHYGNDTRACTFGALSAFTPCFLRSSSSSFRYPIHDLAHPRILLQNFDAIP